ncbi:MAG: hypothetical protein JWM67_1696 [Mycobacterium sp.]|nr:hypothetical protein [Mycobacterium sp.]
MSNEASLEDLRRQAGQFAADLTRTVQIVTGPDTPPFRLLGSTDRRGQRARLTIRQDPNTGIPLQVQGRSLLNLRVHYRAAWDHAQRFLAVDRSQVAVYVPEVSEPLFRYEYEREGTPDIPGAHIQVHGHRDALTFVMAACGDRSARGRRRARDIASGQLPRMADLHLPVGGPRFRPCLEDVLEMLVTELGVDAPAEALPALGDGREQWRRDQLAAAVRDSPETAARVLEQELGYRVARPAGGARQDRVGRIRAL